MRFSNGSSPSKPPAALARLIRSVRALFTGSMKRLVRIAVVVLGVYVLWNMVFASGTWRYKLTLVVDDNGTQRTGSGVIQVHVRENPRITPETGYSTSIKGEAIAVDLASKGTFFVLLRNSTSVDYAAYFITDIFPPPIPEGKKARVGFMSPEGLEYYSHLQGKRDVPLDKLPMLVRFRDINDPMTVEKVDPADLEKTFGPGVKLISATIEMTDEPVTRGMEKRLPWISQYYSKLLDGQRYETINATNRLANSLGSGDFSAGGFHE
jgi:hypothetical protein